MSLKQNDIWNENLQEIKAGAYSPTPKPGTKEAEAKLQIEYERSLRYEKEREQRNTWNLARHIRDMATSPREEKEFSFE